MKPWLYDLGICFQERYNKDGSKTKSAAAITLSTSY